MFSPKHSQTLFATLFVLASAVSPVGAGDVTVRTDARGVLPPVASADVRVLDGGFFLSSAEMAVVFPGSLLRLDGDSGALRSGISLGLRLPLDIAVAADGSIVVADSYLGFLGLDGTPQLLHAVPGVGTRVIAIAPELVPTGVAFDSTGRLLVTTFGQPGGVGADGRHLLLVDPATGQATDLLPGFDFAESTPFAVAVSANDEIYISVLGDDGTGSILLVDTENQTADPVAEGLTLIGLPHFGVDPDGWLVVPVDVAGVPTLIRIDPSGAAADETILSGAPLSSSAGIAVDAAGTIFVLNSSFGSFDLGPLEVIEITDAAVRILPTEMETNGAFGLGLTSDGDPIVSRLPPRGEQLLVRLAAVALRSDR